jgi:hypothetical protein
MDLALLSNCKMEWQSLQGMYATFPGPCGWEEQGLLVQKQFYFLVTKGPHLLFERGFDQSDLEPVILFMNECWDELIDFKWDEKQMKSEQMPLHMISTLLNAF